MESELLGTQEAEVVGRLRAQHRGDRTAHEGGTGELTLAGPVPGFQCPAMGSE